MTKIKENKGFNKDIMFLLIFAVLVLVFLFNPLMTGKSYILDDIESQHYIFSNYMYEMGTAGKLFFWYPYMYSGQPFVADPHSAVFYPPNWIYFFIPPERAMVYHVLIHFLIAGIFTFLLLRKYRMKPPAALAGAIIYTFSSFMILRIIHLNIMTGCALIPMVFFGAAYFLEKKNFTSALVLGFCMGVHLLAGMFQMSQIMFIITGIYIIGHLDFKNFINIENLKIFGLFILAVVFSLMVSSVQLLTSYEFVSHSVRIGGIPLEMAMMGALGLKEMVLFLIPDYFGTASSPGGYRGGTFFWEVCFYVGFFPLMLAITAPFIADKEEKQNIIVFGIIAFIGLAISLGKNGLLYSIFYHIVPFFKSQRIPARYLVVLLMPITFYAALTIDKLTGITSEISKKDRGKCKILLSIFSFIFAALTLFVLMASPPEKTGMILFIITGTAGLALFFLTYLKKMNSTIFQYASILIIFISALVFNYGIVKAPTDDTSYFKNRSKHFAAIENRKPPMRVYYFPEQNLKMTLNHPGTRGVSNIVGYNPLILDRYAEYMLAAEGSIRLSSHVRGELIQHANMFEITKFNEEMTRLLNIELAYSFDYQPEYIRMRKSELKNSYPRAFLVDDHIVIPQRQKVLQALKSPHADPSRILLLEQDPGFTLMDGGRSEEELKIAEFVEFEPDYIKLKVNPDRQSWLFLSEIYFPGWKARVDGEERKVFRAHSIFRSVPLKPGEKIVELYYEPTYFKMGAILSILAIIILISASVVNAVKMRKNRSDAYIQAVPQLRKSS